jgi:hypothetical protein
MMVRRRTLGHHQWGHMHHCHYRHHNNSMQTQENKNKISLLQQQQIWVQQKHKDGNFGFYSKLQNKKKLHQRSLIFFTTCVICKQNKKDKEWRSNSQNSHPHLCL